ncbi:MAG: methylated-DNA--[protein]-cysteine S-methyltransferase [Sulfurimonas sp.]|uniref:methylated-DNA--[protein]-cysteine S-methyltransferase n=1 Tax=Sulfurimonas sp. TaxID=2022749 RepID=UPI002610E532|nr:methylated-DNA--[protein]-cysteine S-methyltransferase [Sulfurimonas sp.]MDD2651564.1 methylated-DNA--[protein]-cysteine S-methyltransferase [Sulfurimonas sp.]MDD3451375.1 methylated-DNA--[protein]-cysteine S-methyltransferase [Sulfurimonas sp.]
MSRFSRIISTPIGDMIAVTDGVALIYLDFVDEDTQKEYYSNSLLLQLEEELNEYFSKKRQIFTVPLCVSGTNFQKGVWDTLLKIPFGKTLSYAQEAKLFGNPKATRAVANANSKNPISIIIPCHRVIASNGAIGGYSGGVWRKEFLLSLERAELA